MNPSTITYPQPLGLWESPQPGSNLTQDNPEVGFAPRLKSRALKDEPEHMVVHNLRKGEEAAFGALIDRYQTRLLRLARSFVSSEALAEEVVQDTWVAVLEGIHRFEGRSSIKTWIFKILMNRAKTNGQRENRYVSFAKIPGQKEGESESMSEAEDFFAAGPQKGKWASPPTTWEINTPERILSSNEGLAQIDQAINTLPPIQRQVITLRDIEGIEATEVCGFLHLTSTNQRVILHRARSTVRRILNRYLQEASTRS